MATTAIKTSDRGIALRRTLVATFEALKEHAKVSPAEVADLYDAIASHVRSASPQSFLTDTSPIRLVEPETVTASTPVVAGSVRRELSEGAAYEFRRIDESIVLRLEDPHGDDATVAMGVAQLRTFVEDARSVL